MTNPPGDAPNPPEQPDQPDRPFGQEAPRPEQEQARQEDAGYWERQAQQQEQARQQAEQQRSAQPPYPPPYYPSSGYPGQMQYSPDHPRATTSLVLGILSIVVCQVLGPFAWAMGKKTLDEIDASQGRWGGRGAAQAGYILGIVGTVMLALAVVVIIFYVIVMVALIGGGVATTS
jgi:hypothetical protein